MKTEIVKWVSLLMSSLPCRLPSGVDIKLALEGYCIALDGCNIADLEEAVNRCLKGVDVEKWAPSPPELAQLVRNAKARRENPALLETRAKAVYSATEYPDDDERARMMVKAEKLVSELVAATDARRSFNWAEFLTRHQPADGDYNWRERPTG